MITISFTDPTELAAMVEAICASAMKRRFATHTTVELPGTPVVDEDATPYRWGEPDTHVDDRDEPAFAAAIEAAFPSQDGE